MKMKVTRKEIMNNFVKVVYVPYCEASTLLRYADPIGYNAGVYGWNFDLYAFGNVAVCTGYRNLPGTRANNYREYEKKARKILDRPVQYVDEYKSKVRKPIERLLKEFIEQA